MSSKLNPFHSIHSQQQPHINHARRAISSLIPFSGNQPACHLSRAPPFAVRPNIHIFELIMFIYIYILYVAGNQREWKREMTYNLYLRDKGCM